MPFIIITLLSFVLTGCVMDLWKHKPYQGKGQFLSYPETQKLQMIVFGTLIMIASTRGFFVEEE